MRLTALSLALFLLTGCSGAISFQRVELMAMIDDERGRYNLQAGLVNRACLSVIAWLLTIGSAVARAYGIPIPSPSMGAAQFAGAPPVPTLPLMP